MEKSKRAAPVGEARRSTASLMRLLGDFGITGVSRPRSIT
jgi:hypothetical protein